MAAHTRALETAASPDRVWRIWSDGSTWPHWNPDVLSVATGSRIAESFEPILSGLKAAAESSESAGPGR